MPSRYLGLTPRPGFGVRLPDVVLPTMYRIFKELNVVANIMLSYHRETGPEDVIASLNPRDFLKGHTGTSIKEYISKARKLSDLYSVVVEIEADHVSLMASPERAIKRISGAAFEYGLTDEEIRESLNYIEKEMKEAKEVGGVEFVTVDTCELVDLGVDKLSESEVLARYESEVPEDVRRSLEKKYIGKVFTFLGPEYCIEVKFSRIDVARLALKYLKSIEYVEKVYSLVETYLGPVGLEVALDELPELTPVKDLVFYLNELRDRGLNINFIAPNVGFRKREDYAGELGELRERLEVLSTVAKSFGTLLSIHSGSGAHPYSDKGIGVWETVRDATSGLVKYKVSGIFIQLLLEVMARFPRGSRPRTLYEEIFSTVHDYLIKEVEKRGYLYSPELEQMLRRYEDEVRKGLREEMDPRADFFRHYFFLFQTVRDSRGFRYLREKVLELYREDEELRKAYERELAHLLTRFLTKLGYVNNAIRWRTIHIA
ncbi:MAG: hypothetical protein DRJ40_10105 [Thermoprotei archaeon]|nr:MAG: hypothetical protein DRJ40_10105 [Thermoprotei archaeon]